MMFRIVPIEVYKEKDEKDSLYDSQNFRIRSKVYEICHRGGTALLSINIELHKFVACSNMTTFIWI